MFPGHAGHVNITIEGFHKLSKIDKDQDFYNLRTQVEHKLDFLQNHLNSSAKIHLIGHSIGAWMIVELLETNDNLMQQVSSINLLFPTLQRMAETKNGKFLNNVFRRMQSVILFLLRLLYLMPGFLFTFLIHLYLRFRCLPLKYSPWFIKLINPLVIKNVLFLAFDEMDSVRALNSDGLTKIKHLTNVIYGLDDGWAPIEYMDELKKYEPWLKMTLVPIEHAFVLRFSECVADMVANFIKLKTLT